MSSKKSQEMVTLGMVASAAGVSPSTVSRILTGSARVSDSKRAAVEEAIQRLGYQPNVMARGLAQGRTYSIGVLTQDINSPFYGEALRGIEDALAGTGIVPLFVSGHWHPQDEVDRIALMLARRVDGVIILTGCLTDEQLLDYAQKVPVVVTGRELTGHGLTSLRVDDFTGAKLATQHLIGLGHRVIAHIAGPQDHGDSVERLRGYRAALMEAGINFNPNLVIYADFHEPSGVIAVNQLLSSHQSFTAIFAANDQTAFGARLAFFQRGIRVPEDVSLVGFDDIPAAQYAIPPLTTVHQPIYELGRIAAQSLLNSIEDRKATALLPPPKLVLRDSTTRMRH
jgi:LacI family transcriptional regulator